MSTPDATAAAPVSRRSVLAAATAAPAFPLLASNSVAGKAAQSLPSWNDGPARKAILDFVRATTDQAGKSLVPPENRIAAFDQDGTLWVEHPAYVEAMFAIDRVHAIAPQHPAWKSREPLNAVLSNDVAAIARFSETVWAEIIFLTHSGMSQAAFRDVVR